MDPPSTVEGAAMKAWILSVQKWIGDNEQGFSVERKLSDDSVTAEQLSVDYENDQSLYAQLFSLHSNTTRSRHFFLVMTFRAVLRFYSRERTSFPIISDRSQ